MITAETRQLIDEYFADRQAATVRADAIVDAINALQRRVTSLEQTLQVMQLMQTQLHALADEVQAIEATLGINPHGTWPTVAARLDHLESLRPNP